MIKITKNKELKQYNTFNLGCVAKLFVEFDKIKEIQEYLKIASKNNNKFFVLGSGSNVLFPDKFLGIIIHSKINDIKVIRDNKNDVILKVGSGVVWDDFVKYCVENNYYGVENLSLIPGTVGASAVQNIGAYGVEAKELIEKVEYLEIKTSALKEIKNSDCEFAYRNSIFKNELHNKTIITNVFYRLKKKADFKLNYGNLNEVLEGYSGINISNVRDAVIKTRQSKLPDTNELGNAGSFFKNPIVEYSKLEELQKDFPKIPFFKIENNKIKIPAGWLIDKAGWKDKGNNRVGVYQNQALVLINKGDATNKDVISFYKQIQEDIFKKFRIRIEPEVVIL